MPSAYLQAHPTAEFAQTHLNAKSGKAEAYYASFGEHRFRSYWFEMWCDYEGRKGPAWEWEPRVVATAFTASELNKTAPKRSVRARRLKPK